MSSTLYNQIYNRIKTEINGGSYTVGEMLPSENAFGKRYGVARMTVRNALILLADEGYIYPVAGKGYYVNDKKFNKYAFNYDEHKIFNDYINETKIISVDIIKPNVDISYNLKVPGNSRVVVIKRFIYANGKKIAYDEKFVPYYIGMPVDDSYINQSTLSEIIANKESLFKTKNILKIDVIETDDVLSNQLSIKIGQSVCKIEMTILDDEGEPLGCSKRICLLDYLKINCQLLFDA